MNCQCRFLADIYTTYHCPCNLGPGWQFACSRASRPACPAKLSVPALPSYQCSTKFPGRCSAVFSICVYSCIVYSVNFSTQYTLQCCIVCCKYLCTMYTAILPALSLFVQHALLKYLRHCFSIPRPGHLHKGNICQCYPCRSRAIWRQTGCSINIMSLSQTPN